MDTKTKANIKRVLNVFWHLEPTSDIYMFHHVTMTPEVERSRCKLDTEDFVHFLDQKRDYVSLDALTDDKRYPRKAAITFDDGLEDTFTVAYPILRQRQIPFTVFVLSHMVGQPGYLSAEQLKKMQRDPLVTIGVHGSKHRILTECTPEEQAEEIFASKQVLEKLLGQTCDLFAYSHGQYDDNIRKLTAFAGYRKAFAVAGRPLNAHFDKGPYAYPRMSVEADTKAMFGL